MADFITLDAIVLPKDLEWTDEFTWTPIAQLVGYGGTGALFIQESTRQAGRPITLSGKDDMGWITRDTAIALKAKMDVADNTMTLTLSDDRTFQVMFRQTETPIEIANIKGFDELADDALFSVTALRFMEVV